MVFKDVFLSNYRNYADIYWAGFYLIITLLFFVGFLSSLTIQSYGLIYVLLSFISLFFLSISISTKNKNAGLVVFGTITNKRTFARDVIIGLLIGIVFISGFLGFSIVLQPAPFTISPAQTIGQSLLTLLIVGFFGVEAEEMFRASTLIPSLLRYIETLPLLESLYAGLNIFAALLLFLFINILGSTIIGIVILMLGIGFIIENKVKKIYKPKKSYGIFNHLMAIVFAALVFMMLHVYAYGSGSYTTNISAYISNLLYLLT